MTTHDAEPTGEYITITPSPEMRAAVLAAAGLTDLSYDDSGDLVPGWHDSPEGQADAADQARWDRQETRTNG